MEREKEWATFLLSVLGWLVVRAKTQQQVKRKVNDDHDCRELSGYESLIGNTPLIKLNSLSTLIECDVYVKVCSPVENNESL
jgi:hypothetical protein